jgi:hypothetical protein
MLVPKRLDSVVKKGIDFFMARQQSLDAPGILHHVMARVIDVLKIFGGRKESKKPIHVQV